MARRITAILFIIVILGLALALMWRVYLHHRAGGDDDDERGVIASEDTGRPSSFPNAFVFNNMHLA